jgi:hypothetical protein
MQLDVSTQDAAKYLCLGSVRLREGRFERLRCGGAAVGLRPATPPTCFESVCVIEGWVYVRHQHLVCCDDMPITPPVFLIGSQLRRNEGPALVGPSVQNARGVVTCWSDKNQIVEVVEPPNRSTVGRSLPCNSVG